MQEVDNLRGIRLAYEVERAYLQGARKLSDKLGGFVRAKRRIKDLPGVFDTALGDIALRHANFVEFLDYGLFNVGLYAPDTRNRKRKLLDLVPCQIFVYLRGRILSERDEQHRRFFARRKGFHGQCVQGCSPFRFVKISCRDAIHRVRDIKSNAVLGHGRHIWR